MPSNHPSAAEALAAIGVTLTGSATGETAVRIRRTLARHPGVVLVQTRTYTADGVTTTWSASRA